jgi:hypothetical protein
MILATILPAIHEQHNLTNPQPYDNYSKPIPNVAIIHYSSLAAN